MADINKIINLDALARFKEDYDEFISASTGAKVSITPDEFYLDLAYGTFSVTLSQNQISKIFNAGDVNILELSYNSGQRRLAMYRTDYSKFTDEETLSFACILKDNSEEYYLSLVISEDGSYSTDIHKMSGGSASELNSPVLIGTMTLGSAMGSINDSGEAVFNSVNSTHISGSSLSGETLSLGNTQLNEYQLQRLLDLITVHYNVSCNFSSNISASNTQSTISEGTPYYNVLTVDCGAYYSMSYTLLIGEENRSDYVDVTNFPTITVNVPGEYVVGDIQLSVYVSESFPVNQNLTNVGTDYHSGYAVKGNELSINYSPIEPAHGVDISSVLMGGYDITSSAVSGNTVYIGEVTGEVNIWASGINEYWNIEKHYPNGSYESNPTTSAAPGCSYDNTVTISASEHPEATARVYMGGIEVTGEYSSWDDVNKSLFINIPSVDGNVEIIFTWYTPTYYSITENFTNCSGSGEMSIVEGGYYFNQIFANPGYSGVVIDEVLYNGVDIKDEPGIVNGNTVTISAVYSDISVTAHGVYIPVQDISLATNSLTLSVGAEYNLSQDIIFNPADATNKSVSYSSDGTSAATVNGYGTIFANEEGTSVITVTSDDNSSAFASVTVTVEEQPEPQEVNISILQSDNCHFSGVADGDTTTVGATLTFEIIADVANPDWQGLSTITIEMNGEQLDNDDIIDYSQGNTLYVTIPYVTGNIDIWADCVEEGPIPLEGISFYGNPTMTVGDYTWAGDFIDFNPPEADDTSLASVISSNENIIAVHGEEIEAVSEGTCTITATSQDGGYTASATFTVDPEPEPEPEVYSLEFDTDSIEILDNGEQLDLYDHLIVDGDDSGGLTWASSDDEIIVVDGGGVATVTNGTVGQSVTITVESMSNPGVEASVTVVIGEAPEITSLTFTNQQIYIYENDTLDLTNYLVIGGDPDAGMNWSSGNSNILEVDDDGIVSMGSEGVIGLSASITVSAKNDSSITDTTVVTIISRD